MSLMDYAPKRSRQKIDPEFVPPAPLAPLAPLAPPDPHEDLSQAAIKHLKALDDLNARNVAMSAEIDRSRKLIDRLEAELAVMHETCEAIKRDRDQTYSKLIAVETKFETIGKIALEVLGAARGTEQSKAPAPAEVDMQKLEDAMTGANK